MSQHSAFSKQNPPVLNMIPFPQHILGLLLQSACLTMWSSEGNLTVSCTDLYSMLYIFFSLPFTPFPRSTWYLQFVRGGGSVGINQSDHFLAFLIANFGFRLLRSAKPVTNGLAVFSLPKCVTVFLLPTLFVLWDL